MGAPRRLLNWQPRSLPVRRPNDWRSPKGDRRSLNLAPSENVSQWPSIEEQCKRATKDISPGYKRAIALLRSLRNVRPEEIEKKRESYDLLVQVMDEDRYH
jgi:hypothetical protein